MGRQSNISRRKEQLAESRARLTSGVEYLALTHVGLGDSGTKRLAGALLGNKTLRWLHLDDNRIGDKGARYLGRVLTKNKSLRVLDLDFNNIAAMGASALASALTKNNSLQELDLHFNEIGSAGAIKFAEALEVNTALQSFSLHGNDIGDVGATSLALALWKNTTLRDLHLGSNAICDTGTFQFAEALQNNNKLWALHLTENEIGDAGASSLAKALLSKPSLGELWLLRNKISEVGARELLKCMPGLRRLGITFYEDSDNHEPELLERYRERHTLQHAARKLSAGVACLHVDNPKLGDESVRELVDLIQANKKVKELHLKSHCLSDAGMQHLAKALQKCPHIEKIYLGGRYLGNGRFTRPRLFKKPRTGPPKPPGDEVQTPQQHDVALTVPGLPRNGLRDIDGMSDYDAPGLAFSEVPSTLGLETISNITDTFSAASTIEDLTPSAQSQDQEQSPALFGAGVLLSENGNGSPAVTNQEQAPTQCQRGVVLVETADNIGPRKPLRTDAGGSGTSSRKPGLLNKILFRSTSDLYKLSKNETDRIDSASKKLTFDQVPETFPDISDSESECSADRIDSEPIGRIPAVASGPALHFDQVPLELPVSDSEEEDEDEDDADSPRRSEADQRNEATHELTPNKLDEGASVASPTPNKLDQGASAASPISPWSYQLDEEQTDILIEQPKSQTITAVGGDAGISHNREASGAPEISFPLEDPPAELRYGVSRDPSRNQESNYDVEDEFLPGEEIDPGHASMAPNEDNNTSGFTPAIQVDSGQVSHINRHIDDDLSKVVVSVEDEQSKAVVSLDDEISQEVFSMTYVPQELEPQRINQPKSETLPGKARNGKRRVMGI